MQLAWGVCFVLMMVMSWCEGGDCLLQGEMFVRVEERATFVG